MSPHEATVIVIGAGLAGLSASLGLARIGYKIELVEKRTDFGEQGATFGLAPNGAKALEELSPGIVSEHLAMNGVLMSTGGHMLPWWEVRDELLRLVKANENINIRMGLDVCGIDDEPSSSAATVRFNNTDLVLSGQLIIGADGVNSGVRELIGLPPAKKVGTTVWRNHVDVNVAAVKEGSKLPALLDKGMAPLGTIMFKKTFFVAFNFHSKRPGRIAWVVSSKRDSIGPGDTPEHLFDGLGGEEEQIIKEFFEQSAEKENLKKHYPLAIVDFTESWLDERSGWGGKGRVTLIGDAAHAFRPASGQGGSMAFEDSVLLCRKMSQDGISDSIRSYEACQNLIQEFEDARLARVKVISVDENTRAEKIYQGEKVEPWSDEYEKWVFAGIS